MRSLRFACRSWSSLLFGAVVALFGPVASTVGQCGQQWLPGHGMPGVDVYPYSATWWQPTVGGLQNPQLVVGGIFDHAGTVQATNIAAFDWVTRTWSALGAGLPGIVGRVGVLPNGRLIARNCGTNPLLPTIGVYEWDGTNWLPLGGGVNGAVGDFVVMNNGDLIVVGQFTIAGSVPAHNVARWDGTSWHALAQGTPGFTGCITKLPNGDIAVAECYSTSLLPWNPAWYVRIHRWDGANWTTLAQPSMPVRTLTALPNGDLVAGGSFMDIGNCIARWDGTAWMDMSGGIGGTQPIVEGLLGLGNGDLIATGRFSYIGGAQVANVARWNGSSWLPMGNGLNGVGISAFELPTGEVALVGNFTEAGDVEATGVALWNGVDWRATGNELDGSVRALAVATNGDLLAGGAFTSGLDTTLHGIGRWDGAAWNALGGGVSGGDVHAIAQLANGDVVAVGAFVAAGGTPAAAVARWDGVSWSALGSGLAGTLARSGNAVVALSNGDVVVGGDFALAGGSPANAIARWNGTAWASLGTGLQGGAFGNPIANALVVMPNGDLVVGGRFQSAGGVTANSVARWNGATWSAMAGGLLAPNGATVQSLALLPNGGLVAGGSFTSPATGVALWDGTQWLAVGVLAGTVQSVVALPNGDIVAGGQFPSGDSFMRWSQGVWAPFATGQHAVDVHTMLMLPNGEIAIAGDFPSPVGQYWTRIHRVATTCPAFALTYGAGCSGAGGINQLAPVTLPWLGSTYRANASGLAGNSLAVGVLGLGGMATPLSALLPQGLPGCTLWVTPDVLSLQVPNGGTVQWPLVIPNSMALATQSFLQQVVAIQLATSGAITGVTSANALMLTIGSF